jgi:GNAT superfamily N-acetyltransferase
MPDYESFKRKLIESRAARPGQGGKALTYRIRECSIHDIPQVIRLSRLWAAEGITQGYENVRWTEEKLAARISEYFCIAEHGQSVVAYAFGKVKTGEGNAVIRQGELYLDIHEVYIEEGHRANGLGTQLVQTLLEKAECNGVHRATVGSSNRDWQPTARFYEQLGFGMWYIQMYK